MTTEPVTLHLPDELYAELKQRAEKARHSVEEELLALVTDAIPVSSELPADIATVVSQLSALDDEALWRAARSHLDADAAARLEELHMKAQRQGLDEVESREAAELTHQYEHFLVVRAQAALLLKERGYDVSELTTPL